MGNVKNKIQQTPALKWKRMEQYVVTKICVEFPEIDEVEQDHLGASGDKRPSRAMSVAEGFRNSRSQSKQGKYTAWRWRAENWFYVCNCGSRD